MRGFFRDIRPGPKSRPPGHLSTCIAVQHGPKPAGRVSAFHAAASLNGAVFPACHHFFRLYWVEGQRFTRINHPVRPASAVGVSASSDGGNICRAVVGFLAPVACRSSLQRMNRSAQPITEAIGRAKASTGAAGGGDNHCAQGLRLRGLGGGLDLLAEHRPRHIGPQFFAQHDQLWVAALRSDGASRALDRRAVLGRHAAIRVEPRPDVSTVLEVTGRRQCRLTT